MPLRKIEYDNTDALNDAIVNFPFNENSKFITVSLKPTLYKESFQNQYAETTFQLKQYIECVATDAIVVIEATKKTNVHYHILANSEHSNESIDDFVRNFKKLGNTFTKKCNDPKYKVEISNSQMTLSEYMTKDFTRTEELLNGLYVGSYIAPAFRYTHYEKKPTVKRSMKKIIKINPNDIDSDDEDKWLCAENSTEIFISQPPKPEVIEKQNKINKKIDAINKILAEKYAINYD